MWSRKSKSDCANLLNYSAYFLRVATVVAFGTPHPLLAQQSVPPVVPQQAEQQQSNLTQQREEERRLRLQTAPLEMERAEAPETECPSGQGWMIRSIDIQGAQRLDAATIEALKAPLIGKTLTCKDIDALREKVYDLYVKQNYPLTQTLVNQQALEQGILQLVVIAATVERYTICKNGRPRLGYDTVFPIRDQESFTLRGLEHGAENLARLETFQPGSGKAMPSSAAGGASDADNDCAKEQQTLVSVAPGSLPGRGIVVVQTRQPRPIFVTAGVDSLGSRSTGRTRVNASIGLEDLFGAYESFVIRGSHTTDFDDDADRARNLAGEFSMPLGYWRVQLAVNYYDYRTAILLGTQQFVSSGDQTVYNIDLARTVRRTQHSVLELGGGLIVKEVNNFINELQLDSSSRRLVSLNARIAYRTVLWGGALNGTLELAQGIRAFNALDDGVLQKRDPHAQFTQSSLTLGFSRSFGLGAHEPSDPPPGGVLAFATFLSASWAPHALYGTEKVQIGGPFTVRGFDDSSLSGDAGGFLRSELSYRPPLRTPDWFGKLSVFGFIDAGVIVQDYADASVERSLAGAGAGVRLDGRNLRAEARVETPIHAPAFLPPNDTVFRFLVAVKL